MKLFYLAFSLVVVTLGQPALSQLNPTAIPTAIPTATNFVQWDFNQPPSVAPSFGSGSLVVLGNLSVTNASGAGSSDPLGTGDQALALTRFPAATNPTVLAGVEFRTDPTGYREVSFRCDLRPTGSASAHVRLEYSLDAGATYQNGAELVLTKANTFARGLVLDLAAVTEAGDRADLRIRIVSIPGPGDVYAGVSTKYSPNGSWRVDMVTFSGTPLVAPPPPEPPIAPPGWSFVNQLSGRSHAGEPLTNSFPEISLRFGQTLRLEAQAQDPNSRAVNLKMNPPVAGWTFSNASENRSSATATFNYEATSLDAGRRQVLELIADNGAASSAQRWVIYVPTAAEQGIIVSEFLANPPAFSVTNSVDSLGRGDLPASTANSTGEFVELANVGLHSVSLAGWSLRDATGLRHRYAGDVTLGSGTATIIYGGPLTNGAPRLGAEVGIAVPASSGGLSLNNSGDVIELRNAASNLIERVVYRGVELNGGSSLVRRSLPDGAFGPHPQGSSGRWSPGIAQATVIPSTLTVPRLSIQAVAGGVLLQWIPVSGQSFRVVRATAPDGPFTTIGTEGSVGSFRDSASADFGFYRLERE